MSVLSGNSVLEEIRRLQAGGQSGILALTGAGGEHVDVYFREGMIEAVSSNLEAHRLGDYLVRDGHLRPQDIEAAKSEALRHRMFLGEAVVRKRLLSQMELGASVRRQAIELLEHVLKNGFGVDSFTSSLRPYYAPARITFPHVLLELSRSTGEPFEPQSKLQIVLSDRADLSAFPWSPHELCVLNELRYPNTFDGVLQASGLGEAALKTILGVLGQLGVIDIIDPLDSAGPVALAESGAIAKPAEFRFEHLIPVVTNAVLNEKLEVARNEFSFTSEQFKTLKVQIAEANSAMPLKVIAVSSPDPQDGKSLIAANLAFSFARDLERRVIIVDFDLRSPSLEHYLGVTSEPGLLQCLANGHLSPYCYVRRVENLYFMTTGGVAPNPIEILSMQKLRQLIEILKRDFDTIILDAPPYSPIADARIVTGLSDGLILVVRRGKTSYSSIDRAFKSIDRNKLLGAVFNDVQPMLFHTYYNFGYYYYGKRGEVYSAKQRPGSDPKKYLQA